ncbi:histidine kinase [Streptomyces sp. H27-C3]|uniref:sensor histidine kinase n=1 Tax=Streptomyces sp. H27-C3 TaxID=3046305 RepID=UPI0024B9F00C|nr:histidine kinase [Streptomyces sp. H27-C3]MDJ0466880.1 histidine kinase [Streptomyces sp. H27-C3]
MRLLALNTVSSWRRAIGALRDAQRARLLDVATCALACGLSLLALDNAHASGLTPAYWSSVLVTAMAATVLLIRRTSPHLTVAVALLSTLASDDLTLLLFASYALGAYGGRFRWGAITVAGLLYISTRAWVGTVLPDLSSVAYYTVTEVWFPAAAGALMRRRRQVTGLLRQRLVAVERAVDQAADMAVLEERTRLAFDIHDSLGYHATVLTLQASALRTCPDLPREAEQRVTIMEEAARGVVRDLRETLDVLRGLSEHSRKDGPSYAQFAAALVANLNAAGVDVSFHLSGRARPLPHSVDEALRHCGRESLTNAVKHGGGAPIRLHLRFMADEVQLEVRNGVSPVTSMASGGGGIGLTSLRARAVDVGGRLETGLTPEGTFRVAVVVPIPAEASPP